MPNYDYRCEACQHEFELFQMMKENPARKCPACGKLKLKRLLGTGAGLIFKGSGFYTTDYRSAGSKESKSEGGKESKSEGSKDSGAGGGKDAGETSSNAKDSAPSTSKKPEKGGTEGGSKGA